MFGQGQAALAALSREDASTGPDRKNLNEFMAALPELWRSGEARPTHRKAERVARYWRTREDPFKDVWGEMLLWLQQEPDATAKALLKKLIELEAERYSMKLLRTLHRRVSVWRRTMSRRLVLGSLEEIADVHAIVPPQSVIGQSPLRLASLASTTSAQ